jgi:hypothetical protein
MTRDDINAVITKIPTLNDSGIGLPKEQMGDLPKEQARLLDRVDVCTKVCEWLEPLHFTETVNRKHTSYGLKRLFEDATKEYVSDGAFIAAAVHSGFCWKQIPNDSSVWLGIAEKSLKPYW